MVRRKSLARRWPYVIYNIKQEDDVVNLRAWEATEFGRKIADRPLANGVIRDWDAEPVRTRWIASNNTDAIHELHEELRDALWQMDDAIREAYKADAYSWAPTRDSR